jgi:hypothetical protein
MSGSGPAIMWLGFAGNLVPVILGNIVGGSVLVGLVYHVTYRRSARDLLGELPHPATVRADELRKASTLA